MKTFSKKLTAILFLVMILGALAAPVTAHTVRAAEGDAVTTEAADTEDNALGSKAIAAGVAIGLAALGGAIGMGMAISKSAEGISRQPEADGKIRTTLMLGLVFIETAIIYALIVAILVIFVL